MTAPAFVYTSRFSVALGALHHYDEWYPHHAADLLGVGFTRVHGFRSAIAPRALSNVYELPDLGVFGQPYLDARERDELGRSVRPHLSPAELAVFVHAADAGHDELGLRSAGLAVLDLAAGGGVEEVLDWYRAEGLQRLTADGRHAFAYRSVDSPVAPATAGALRVIVACPSAEDAFVASDVAASRHVERWAVGSEPSVDVLIHRVSFSLDS